MRHFLIGIIAIAPGQAGVWTGGVDFLLSDYPNKDMITSIVADSFHVKDVRIIAVTEMKDSDYIRFWTRPAKTGNTH